MNFVWSNDDEDWGDTLIPEGAMKSNNLGGVNLFNLTEVNNRTAVLVENTINMKLFKGETHGMGMRHLSCFTVKFINARKEVWRLSIFKAEIFPPVFLVSYAHFPADLLAYEFSWNSEWNRHSQPVILPYHFRSCAAWQ
jgi:hypothetical protein